MQGRDTGEGFGAMPQLAPFLSTGGPGRGTGALGIGVTVQSVNAIHIELRVACKHQWTALGGLQRALTACCLIPLQFTPRSRRM